MPCRKLNSELSATSVELVNQSHQVGHRWKPCEALQGCRGAGTSPRLPSIIPPTIHNPISPCLNTPQHAGHYKKDGSAASEAGETHFKLQCVSDKFAGLNPVKRHQLVYGLLADEFKQGGSPYPVLFLFSGGSRGRSQWVPACASTVAQGKGLANACKRRLLGSMDWRKGVRNGKRVLLAGLHALSMDLKTPGEAAK